MYGIVHEALKDYIEYKYTKSLWVKIKIKANLDDTTIIATELYDDSVMNELVNIAAEQLRIIPEMLMRDFGRSFVSYLLKSGNESLIASAAPNFKTFMCNLDTLFAHAQTIFRSKGNTVFKCTIIDEHRLSLHYWADQQVMTNYLVGFIEGVGDYFKQRTEVKIIKEKILGHDHDEFLVSYHDQK